MTKEEIGKFVFGTKTAITNIRQRTEIIFNNSTKIVGFFEGNFIHSKTYNENKWNFVITNEERKQTPVNGDDIAIINLYSV